MPERAERESVIPSGEVHLWLAPLAFGLSERREIRRVLSRDEVERAERFHFDRDREHFAAARALLRALLGAYLDEDPAGLRFECGAKGKPFLALDGMTPAHLRFNISHSNGYAMYAFAAGREVGIDLELARPGVDWQGIARRFFSELESEEIFHLPEPERLAAFYRTWARREALAKAAGTGIGFGRHGGVLPEERHRWALLDLAAPPGYAAALAMEDNGPPSPEEPGSPRWSTVSITEPSLRIPSWIAGGGTLEKFNRMVLVRSPRGWKATPARRRPSP